MSERWNCEPETFCVAWISVYFCFQEGFYLLGNGVKLSVKTRAAFSQLHKVYTSLCLNEMEGRKEAFEPDSFLRALRYVDARFVICFWIAFGKARVFSKLVWGNDGWIVWQIRLFWCQNISSACHFIFYGLFSRIYILSDPFEFIIPTLMFFF